MDTHFDGTIILAAPPHTRARYGLARFAIRARQAATVAVVAIVPGAWAVWLAWVVLRNRRHAR